MGECNDPIVLKYREKVKGSPLRAIRAMCVECMGGQIALVRDCDDTLCPLNDFRMAKNPYHMQAKNKKNI